MSAKHDDHYPAFAERQGARPCASHADSHAYAPTEPMPLTTAWDPTEPMPLSPHFEPTIPAPLSRR
ncbi:hypothetical protein PE066_06980 [Ramlibacter tataouinensis]|uniref:hypothetical protein n=1 Tax=Ramlibacter tataouinensis TaxID=94132 RepID=UPI0022F3F9B9|nr:hypothetical protein [Ramlibacter tataouinensis]WBY03271.1 hypothetical protein PE066_06980 [Ramlibacter tataouinensis]